jgi:IS30 family transposase
MNYPHLSLFETYQICALLKASKSLSTIPNILYRYQSTTYREVSRNSGLCSYHPQQDRRLDGQELRALQCLKAPSDIWQSVAKLLGLQLSQKQISA